MKKLLLFICAQAFVVALFAQVKDSTVQLLIDANSKTTYHADAMATILTDLNLKMSMLTPTTYGSSAYSVFINYKITTYTKGLSFEAFFLLANTGTSTLSVNGLAAKNLMKLVSGTPTVLSAGDLTIGKHSVYYDGTELIVSLSTSGGGGFTNPMTSIGDLIIGGSGGSAGRLAIGTSTYVLTSNGTTATWSPAGGASAQPFPDNAAILKNNTDNTKLLKFDLSGFTTSTTTTLTPPNFSGTIATRAGTETLTNKSMSGSANTFTNIPLTTAVTGLLPVANGGTGTASPGIVAGTNVTVTGTWPNQTVASSGGGSGITTLTGDVTATGSGSVAATVAKINGSTLTSTFGNTTLIAYCSSAGNDGTAIIGRTDKPFRNLYAAIAALPSNGGKIYLMDDGPFTMWDGTNWRDDRLGLGNGSGGLNTHSVTKSNLTIEGYKMPWIDAVITQPSTYVTTVAAPTKLQNGAIIQGGIDFCAKFNIIVKNVGFDIGSLYAATAPSGYLGQGGLVFLQNALGAAPGYPLNSADGNHTLQTTSPPTAGIIVDHCIALLPNSTSAAHGFLLENLYNPIVSHLYAFYGTHGFAIKSIGGEAKDLNAWGNDSDGIIIKSDDYASCQYFILDGFNINSIGSFDTGGLIIDCGQTGSVGMGEVTVSNGAILATKFGIQLNTSVGGVDQTTFSNIQIYLSNTFGVQIPLSSLANRINFNNVSTRNTGGIGFDIKTGTSINFYGCAATNCGGNGFNLDSTPSGSSMYLFDTKTYLNAGYGVNAIGSNVFGSVYVNQSNATAPTNGTIIPITFVGTANPIDLSGGGGGTDHSYVANYQTQTLISQNRHPLTGTFFNVAAAASYVTFRGLSGDGNIEFYTSNANNALPTTALKITNTGQLTNAFLAGTGTRMVTTDASGNLGSAAIPVSLTAGTNGSDANYTAVANTYINLPVATLTAARTFTMPTAVNGNVMTIKNNEKSFNWTLAGAPVYFSDNTTTLVSFLANTTYQLMVIDGNWTIIN